VEREGGRGFTLVEVLAGVATATIVLSLLVGLAARLTRSAASVETLAQASNAAGLLATRLDAETASAWAVFVPPSDLDGAPNADGHELDFYTEDGAHRPYTWAYRFDAVAHSVTRYAYAPGDSPVATDTFSPIDSFAATTLRATEIASADPLLAGATVTDVAYPMPSMPAAVGGNGAVQLRVGAAGVALQRLLTSQTVPTTFTVLVRYSPSPPPVATPTPTPIAVSTP
jgi:type II secretory pathway pseudopilin PulG